jgi:hypothetical protein
VGLSPPGADNIIAALGQSNRICEVDLYLQDWVLGGVLAAMEVPFPELTDLRISSLGIVPPIFPDSFLGGSVPHLKSFKLGGTLFPGLPNLLLSATHLVELSLIDIESISPDAVVAIISALSGLRILSLAFQPHQSYPVSDWQSRSLTLPKRSILPALHKFHFKGVSEYLEDLVTRIDTPQLDEMDTFFFSDISFDCSLLAQFINRSPTLRVRDEARMQFNNYIAYVELLAQSGTIQIGIQCEESDRLLSSVAQICNFLMHPLSSVKDLYIVHQFWRPVDEIENALLLPFTAVKNLYLSEKSAPGIAAALRELDGGRITEILPNLQNIFVEGLEPTGPFQENIGRFIAARELSDYPVAISDWNKD